jgi:Aerotolerance regulator N-terminal
MISLNPLAWVGLAAVAAPILVHLLAHRRAKRVPFPTLRFLQPTRLSAIRRRVLEDLGLLALRCAIVVIAAAAFAGPLMLTPSRRAAWNARLVRAVVVSGHVTQGPAIAALKGCATPDCFRAQQFNTNTVAEGIHRAVAWLESAPPGRRELVIAAPLTIGSIADVDLAAVPSDVGIRFTRTEDLPAVRRVIAAPLLARTGTLRRIAALAGRTTRVSEDVGDASARWPIEIVAPPDLLDTADAALAAVGSRHVPQPPPDCRGRLILLPPADAEIVTTSVQPSWDGGGESVRVAWMADAIARMARDHDLQEEAARAPSGLADDRFTRAPWRTLARAADGRPMVSAAASSQTLLVATAPRAGDLIAAVVLRAFANGLAPEADLSAAEIVPIPDEQIRAWSRQPGPPAAQRLNTVDRDDRRWLWVAVLLLMIIETWIRRSRREHADQIVQEAVRVA